MLMAAACTRPQYGLEKAAKEKFASLPWLIELEFVVDANYKHDQKLITYVIENGQLVLKSTRTCVRPDTSPCYFDYPRQYIHFPENALYKKTQVTVPEGLPEVKGYQYIGPFSMSPDNSLALLSITPESYKWPLEAPLDIVLIEMRTRKIVYQTNRDGVHYRIKDVAWSVDSHLFAVLYEYYENYYGSSGLIGSMLGHPVSKYAYHLAVYDREGNLVVRSRVAYGMLTGWGNVRFSFQP